MIEFSKIKHTFFLLFIICSLTSCSWEKIVTNPNPVKIQETQNCIKSVKYRSYGRVDVCTEKFVKLGNIGDKSVFWAWYDPSNQYMIIQLKKTNYHYCGISTSDWSWIENASDTDEYYIAHIKWWYDCRNWVVPKY